MNPGDVEGVVSPASPASLSLPTQTSHESARDQHQMTMMMLREEARGVGQAEEESLKKKDLWRSRVSWVAGGIVTGLIGYGAWKWFTRRKDH